MANRLGYLGLGSNVGERRAQLEQAVVTLRSRGVAILRSSSVYETEPVGLVTDQRDFLNAAVQVQTAHGPEELLNACKDVELQLGRHRGGTRHGPRPIDVDVLLLDGLEYSSERLRIPHPEVSTRRFVLVPLLEIDPELRLPGGRPLSDLLEQLGPGQRLERVGAPLV